MNFSSLLLFIVIQRLKYYWYWLSTIWLSASASSSPSSPLSSSNSLLPLTCRSGFYSPWMSLTSLRSFFLPTTTTYCGWLNGWLAGWLEGCSRLWSILLLFILYRLCLYVLFRFISNDNLFMTFWNSAQNVLEYKKRKQNIDIHLCVTIRLYSLEDNKESHQPIEQNISVIILSVPSSIIIIISSSNSFIISITKSLIIMILSFGVLSLWYYSSNPNQWEHMFLRGDCILWLSLVST